MKITEEAILATYNLLKQYHTLYLANSGVVLPGLKVKNQYTKNALVLIYLAQDYPNTHLVTKDELTEFVRSFYPKTNDVQQARHLGAQDGWFILSGTRGETEIPASTYKLVTLEKSYPNFTKERRSCSINDEEWESLKKQYSYKCACCGSEEGKPHRYHPTITTQLQKGHMDPTKPLEVGNIIPQCQICNRPDRNWWKYDKNGRVVGIASVDVVKRCGKVLQQQILKFLIEL